MCKREYEGQEVAVKMLRTYVNGDLQKIVRVSRGDALNSDHSLEPTVICAGVLQRVRDVEDPSSSERLTAPRGDHDQDSVRNGVKVDDEREH